MTVANKLDPRDTTLRDLLAHPNEEIRQEARYLLIKLNVHEVRESLRPQVMRRRDEPYQLHLVKTP